MVRRSLTFEKPNMRVGIYGGNVRRPAHEAGLQHALENPLSLALLEGRFAPGATIAVTRDGSRMHFATAA